MSVLGFVRGRMMVLAYLGTAGCTGEPGADAEAGPTEEEIEVVQQDVCEIRVVRCLKASDPAPQTMEECLDNRRELYGFSDECREVLFEADSCLVDAEADIDRDDPLYDHYVCESAAPECVDAIGKAYGGGTQCG